MRQRITNADEALICRARGDVRAWLRFQDRDRAPYFPSVETTVTTNRTWDVDNGESSSPDWTHEGWSIRSELVPLDQLDKAGTIRWEDHRLIEIGWQAENEYDFGETAHACGVTLLPWCHWWRHPVSGKPLLYLREDFQRYHALVEAADGEFRHPTDDIVVAKLVIETHPFFEPVAHVEVHESYLRDFLAARRWGMLIRIVADRFANATSVAALGVIDTVLESVAQGTWIQTTTRRADDLGFAGFLGRGTLWRNIVIRPFDRPRTDRTPWPYFYARPDPTNAPQYIVNTAGDRKLLNAAECPPYLYFRPEVLQKYLHVPGYRVRFHMRTWGRAHTPGAVHSIDVGINSQGLVNAFAKDLADQRPSEQEYWASFSITPSGDVCKEMFRTNMLCDPPDSISLFEQVSREVKRLIERTREQYGEPFHSCVDPTDKEIDRLTVGPLTRQWSEVCDLAKILYGWTIDRMSVRNIRRAIGGRIPTEDNWGQIKLLESLLVASGMSEEQAKTAIAPLKGLNILRVAAAHLGTADLTKAFGLLGIGAAPACPRDGWTRCVESVASAIGAVADGIHAA